MGGAQLIYGGCKVATHLSRCMSSFIAEVGAALLPNSTDLHPPLHPAPAAYLVKERLCRHCTGSSTATPVSIT